jgi:hypothetical protein
MVPGITFKVDTLENVIDNKHYFEDLTPTTMSETTLQWWRDAIARLAQSERFQKPLLNEDLVAQGACNETAEIEVLFCSRQNMEALYGGTRAESACGLFVVDVHDWDLFNEATPQSHKLRVFVVHDDEEFLKHIAEEVHQDMNPATHLAKYIADHLNTTFHEIAHALLFAENAALLTPQEVDSMYEGGEIEVDLFTATTGYRIRRLPVDGDLHHSVTRPVASDVMEDYVEEQGKIYLNEVFAGEHCVTDYLQAAGLKSQVDAIIENETRALA